MTSAPLVRRVTLDWVRRAPVPAIAAGLAFFVLFWQPLVRLGSDWWTDPESGHGLLLAPIAGYLVWRRGRVANPSPQVAAGLLVIAGAIVLRYLSGLAAELFTMRVSLFAAAAGLIIYARGARQLVHWWLPIALLLLSIPVPAVLLNTIAFPLQLKASQVGATLLEWRGVPVLLAGNVIHLPGRSMFVTEACSGLRSLTALLALGVLIGGLGLRRPWTRAALLAIALPVAVSLNGLRVFLTGFLVFYVSPGLGEGFMHYTEGWAIFVVAFGLLGAAALALGRFEARPSPAAAT
jgi:exosortase